MSKSTDPKFTREEALQISQNVELSEYLTNREIAILQLNQDKLFLKFDTFHKCAEELLNRPIWTHEFANPKRLLLELLGLEQPRGPMQSAMEEVARAKSEKAEDTVFETDVKQLIINHISEWNGIEPQVFYDDLMKVIESYK